LPFGKGWRGKIRMSKGATIYTLGTSTRSAEEFLQLLKSFGMELVVDVRRFPTSRFPHFRREELGALLSRTGIAYLYLGEELGGYRSGGYPAYVASDNFARGLGKLEEVGRGRKTAILCAERLPWRCHRRYIGEGLERRGWEVVHIIDERRWWQPGQAGR